MKWLNTYPTLSELRSVSVEADYINKRTGKTESFKWDVELLKPKTSDTSLVVWVKVFPTHSYDLDFTSQIEFTKTEAYVSDVRSVMCKFWGTHMSEIEGEGKYQFTVVSITDYKFRDDV